MKQGRSEVEDNRPYANNLKRLLIQGVPPLTFEEAMIAYEWFDYYYEQYGKDGKKAFIVVRQRVRQRNLDERPPSSLALSLLEEIRQRIKSWLT